MVSSDGERFMPIAGMGYVSEIFRQEELVPPARARLHRSRALFDRRERFAS